MGRIVVSRRKKMVNYGTSKGVPVSASQSFESGQLCRRSSFHGKGVIIMSSSKENTSSSGCCKRRRPSEEAVVDSSGGPMEKRRKMEVCMSRRCLDLLEELKEHPVAAVVKRFLQAKWKSVEGNSKHQEDLKVGKGKVWSVRSNSGGSRSKPNKSESDGNMKLPLNNARKNLQRGMMISNGGSGGAQGSISNPKPPLMRQGACRCSSCGSIKCQCSRSSDSSHASSMIKTSQRSLGGKIQVCSAVGASNKFDCQAKNTLTSELSKSDPDSGGVESALDNVGIGSQLTIPATDAGPGEESLTAPTFEVQMSPKKALRAVMLKTRFADTIMKAQQTLLRVSGNKANPVKIQREKAKLERKLGDENANVEAHIRSSECKAKLERERQREAARIALQNMENTAGIELNFDIQKELETLTGCSDLSGGNPLHHLGLFLKDEYWEDDDDAVMHDDVEEGEILP